MARSLLPIVSRLRRKNTVPPLSPTRIRYLADGYTTWGKWLVNRWQTPSVGSDPFTGPGDTGTPWPNGSGINELDGAYGPGLQFRCAAECQVSSGGKKSEMFNQRWPGTSPAGYTDTYKGWFMLPSSGNPSGFVRGYSSWTQLWEIHATTSLSPGANGTLVQFGVDTEGTKNDLYVTVYDANTGTRPQVNDPRGALSYDQWYSWQFKVRWATDSTGWFEAWLDGTKLLSRYNQKTINAGEGGQLQFGFYSYHLPSMMNEVRHSGMEFTRKANT